MERKKRMYMHKGKLRAKRRLPRKEKKRRKNELKKHMIMFDEYCNKLKNIHGEHWFEHIILGG